mmetsp:Transcript_69449/g.166489  ORF Transcript_69449/g.166489 Transcript_69449/m.166489 type:complete len:89 (+) Transcript_69449:890-1156(+)
MAGARLAHPLAQSTRRSTSTAGLSLGLGPVAPPSPIKEQEEAAVIAWSQSARCQSEVQLEAYLHFSLSAVDKVPWYHSCDMGHPRAWI